MSQIFVQYIVIRGDLIKKNFSLGALIAQACHASSAIMHIYHGDVNTVAYTSDLDNMHKIILEAVDESSLVQLSKQLTEAGVDFKLWIEQPENFPTCLATKPYRKEEIQQHFKNFKLLK